MKKTFTFIYFLLFLICTAQAGNIITLDLKNPTNPPQLVVDEEKGHWIETYNNSEELRHIEFDLFSFNHIPTGFGGEEVGGGMSYWDGFTYCTSGDITDHGEFGDSNGWVAEQWGCIAGGGIKTDAEGNVLKDENGKVLVEKGVPYLVAYWGYWMEMMEQADPCLQVNFTDNQAYEPVGVYIANHPWPYYGNIHGDGFASPFTEDGQFFKLTVHGVNENGEDIGVTVDHMLAEFKNGELIQSPDWEWVDLSSLGRVNGIFFTMDTSDADPIYGPNTAVYFCMDKLQVRAIEESTAPSRPTGLTGEPSETSIDFEWTASTASIGVKGYNIYLDDVFKAFVEGTTYTFTDLSPFQAYNLSVEALATDNTPSEKASTIITTTDETAPSAPSGLAGVAGEYSIILSWNPATDNVGVYKYNIYLDGELVKRASTLSYTLTELDKETSYFIEVEATDASGNSSEKVSLTISTSGIATNIEGTNEAHQIIVLTNTIHIENATEGTLNIYDTRGRIHLSTKISRENSIVDISHLGRGIYIARYKNITEKITR